MAKQFRLYMKPIFSPKNLSELKTSSKVSLVVLGTLFFILSIFVCLGITFGPYSQFFRKDIFLFAFSIMFPMGYFLPSLLCFYGFIQTKKIKTVAEIQTGHKRFNIYAIPVFLFPQLFGAIAYLRFARTYSFLIFITVVVFLIIYFFSYRSSLRLYKKIKDWEDSLL